MLDPILKSLDGLDPKIAAEYTETEENGETQFRLDVRAADGFELANTRALKTALESERATVKELKREGGGEAAKEAAALKAEVETLKGKLATKGGDESDAVKAAREELKQFHAAEMEALTKEKSELEGSLYDVMVRQSAQEALAKGGFKEAGHLMLDAVMKQMRVGRDADSGQLVTEVINPKLEGQPRRIGSSEAEWMTTEQLVAEFRESPEYGRFADGSGQSGGDNKGGGSETVQPGNTSNLNPVERLNAVFGGQ